MKKKVFAALLAVCMVIGVTGCGSNAEATANDEPEEVYTHQEDEPGFNSETMDDTQEDLTEVVSEVETEDAVTEEAETVTSEAQDDVPPALDEPDTAKMIICARLHNRLSEDCVIFSVDSKTGGYVEKSHFSYTSNGEVAHVPALQLYHQNYSDMFTPNFDKMAVIRIIGGALGHGVNHAGWIDENGTFFDVPEALGMTTASDFVMPPSYYSVGFTDNGEYFVFLKMDEEDVIGPTTNNPSYFEEHGEFYYVAVNDPSTVYEGNPLAEEATQGKDVQFITDWIDEDRYLSASDQNCLIRSVSNPRDIVELVPGETRINRSAIVGPGGIIAFTSASKTDVRDIAIYTIDLGTNDTQRIFDCDVLIPQDWTSTGSVVFTYLLSWE